MAKLQVKGGSTNKMWRVFLQKLSDGTGFTGLLYNTSGLTCYSNRDTDASTGTAITLADIPSIGTFVSGGFRELDPTNQPGVYLFYPPNAQLAAGAESVDFYFNGVADLAPGPIEVELTATDNQDGVKGGISNLNATITSRASATVAPSWYTAPVDVSANVSAIKAKTDLLTFTDTLLQVNVIDWDSLVVHAITFDGANYPLTAVRVWADPSVGNKYVHVVNSGLGYLQVYVATNADKTGYSLDSSYDPAKTTAQAATALTNLTWTNAKAAFIDAPISGCSTLTAAQVWVNATRTLSAFAFTVLVDMTEDVPTSNTANTLGDCLNAARAQGFGNWTLNLITKVLTLYAADGVTVVHSFTLDSVTAPTQRIT